MTKDTLLIKLLTTTAKMPVRASARSSGLDLFTDNGFELRDGQRMTGTKVFYPGRWMTFGTGVSIALPEGHIGQIVTNIRLARHCGLVVLDAPTTVEEDYLGEITVTLINHGSDCVHVQHGECIARLLITPVVYMSTQVAPWTVP